MAESSGLQSPIFTIYLPPNLLGRKALLKLSKEGYQRPEVLQCLRCLTGHQEGSSEDLGSVFVVQILPAKAIAAPFLRPFSFTEISNHHNQLFIYWICFSRTATSKPMSSAPPSCDGTDHARLSLLNVTPETRVVFGESMISVACFESSIEQ